MNGIKVLHQIFDMISTDLAHLQTSGPIIVGFLADYVHFNYLGYYYYSHLNQVPFQFVDGLRANERFMKLF